MPRSNPFSIFLSAFEAWRICGLVVLIAFQIGIYRKTCCNTYGERIATKEYIVTPRGTYIPSQLEYEMMQLSRSTFHYDVAGADGCDLSVNESRFDFYAQYLNYSKMLDSHTTLVRNFHANISDIRQASNDSRLTSCKEMDNILTKAFPKDRTLSWTRGGYVEPLLPPLRHHKMCRFVRRSERRKWMLNMEYLVHDFGNICRTLTHGTRTAFFDLGASLEFHGGKANPALDLLHLYSKFGIQFDHYYAFEYTAIPPERVFNSIPPDLLPFYHWFNVGIEASPSSQKNPWTSILSKFDVDDFVVVKLDVDTPGVEVPLAYQLLNSSYSSLVDQFYFEYHVEMEPMLRPWRNTANGTLQDSLDLFTDLRRNGIAAHSWV